MAKDPKEQKDQKEQESEAPKAPAKAAKGTLIIHISWNGKEYKAGQVAPDGLVDWLKKEKKNISEYIEE